jgi:putative NADH-flavin reductase
MIVTIFGATGMVGVELVRNCRALGYKVKAFGRNIEPMIDVDLRNEDFEAIKGYVFDEGDVLKALKDSDAVLSALGGATEGTDRTRSLGMKNITQAMDKAGVKRIVAIGGIGLLEAGEDGSLIMDAPDFPHQYYAVSQEHQQAYDYLKNSKTDWTFVCPPTILPKEATGHFLTAANTTAGGDTINAGDLSLFMVKELAAREYVKEKVGIGTTE